MDLIIETYRTQKARWPASGRHILAQFDAGSVIVYQAYNTAIGHFAARSVMNIDGMGDALIDQLVDRGLVKSVSDIYDLTVEKLMELERMGKKSAQNVHRNIEKSKQNPLPRVLVGLGIRRLGQRLGVASDVDTDP